MSMKLARLGSTLVMLVGVALMTSAAFAPGSFAFVASTTKTIDAKSIDGFSCDATQIGFVITQVDVVADAPATIHVVFTDSSSEDLPLSTFTGHTAHYNDTTNLSKTVASASAVIYFAWSGEFNLSHAPCNDSTTTTTTVDATTSTSTTSPTCDDFNGNNPDDCTTTTTAAPTTTTTTQATTTTTSCDDECVTTTTIPVTTCTADCTPPPSSCIGPPVACLPQTTTSVPATSSTAPPTTGVTTTTQISIHSCTTLGCTTPPLPNTGSNSVPVVATGAGLSTLGLVLVGITRKRRHTA